MLQYLSTFLHVAVDYSHYSSSLNGHLDNFLFLIIMSSTALNILNMFSSEICTHFWWELNCQEQNCWVKGYVFIRTQNNFQSSCANLHFYQQYVRVVVAPHPHQTLAFSIMLILAILVGVLQYVIVVLICISLMTNELSSFSYVYWPCWIDILFCEVSFQVFFFFSIGFCWIVFQSY